MTSLLDLKNVSQTFGKFKACDNISFDIKQAEVHAILGENGAGKSTLMKIIYGENRPDKGSAIYLNGTLTEIKSPNHALSLGIGMVHQHFRLVRPFTVLQNIILGHEPTNMFGMIDLASARKKISTIMDDYHFHVDLEATIESLSVGTQQRVEILKILYRNANILILDEPTAVLTPSEIIDFYRIIKNLKEKNKTILIITHKLHEIKEIADRCTIIRKGKFIETVLVNQVSENELASKMVGREVELKSLKTPWIKNETVILDIKNLFVMGDKGLPKIKEFNLRLKKGTITGLAGIDGNGQSELVSAISGLKKIKSGSVFINNEDITNKSAQEIYHHALGVIPEDRQRVGLVLDFSLKENFVLQRIDETPFSKRGIINEKELSLHAATLMKRFDVRPLDENAKAVHLSGGNQQKVILAREIEHNPNVLIAFQPTRGLDVGAIEYIHLELLKLRDQGVAVLLISYELDEILNLSDEIAVIHEGSIVSYLDHETLLTTENKKEFIGFKMAGGKK